MQHLWKWPSTGCIDPFALFFISVQEFYLGITLNSFSHYSQMCIYILFSLSFNIPPVISTCTFSLIFLCMSLVNSLLNGLAAVSGQTQVSLWIRLCYFFLSHFSLTYFASNAAVAWTCFLFQQKTSSVFFSGILTKMLCICCLFNTKQEGLHECLQ